MEKCSKFCPGTTIDLLVNDLMNRSSRSCPETCKDLRFESGQTFFDKYIRNPRKLRGDDDRQDLQLSDNVGERDGMHLENVATINLPSPRIDEHPLCFCLPPTDSTISDASSDSTRMYKFIDDGEEEEDYEYHEKSLDKEKPESISLELLSLSSSTIDECDEYKVEDSELSYTLAIIKPEAMTNEQKIMSRIKEKGFVVCQKRRVHLTPEHASEFYASHYGQLFFPNLVSHMASGPITVMILAKRNAICHWRRLMGPRKITEARSYSPNSLRAQFGREIDDNDLENALHGSDNKQEAEREIHFFFPDFVIEPLLNGKPLEDYLWETINPILTEALKMCCKTTPSDPLTWLAEWLLSNNPNKPKLLEEAVSMKSTNSINS